MAKYSKEKRNKILKESIIENQIYVDSHFHFNGLMEKKVERIEEILSSPYFKGMDIGTQCDDLPKRYNALKKYKNIHLSAGIGPWATENKIPLDKQLEIFEDILSKYPVSAIGEIGLDNYWNYGTKEKQTFLFKEQIKLANKFKLPVIIHNREADEQVIDIIINNEFNYSGIIHCFSGSLKMAKIALEKGFYISFAGPITYKKNNNLRDILEKIPEDRLLLETDSPYLPPEPFRGKFNSPDKMPLIYEEASTVRKVSNKSLAKAIERNFSNLLGNPKRLEIDL